MSKISIPLFTLKANSKATMILAAGILLLLGGALTFYSARAYARGRSALNWQPVPGDLINLEWHSPGEGSDYPTVSYQYAFAGKQYEGGRTCFGAASEATRKLIHVNAGSKITVFVDPANPKESVLFPGASDTAKTCLGIGCGLTVLGLLFAGLILISELNYEVRKSRFE